MYANPQKYLSREMLLRRWEVPLYLRLRLALKKPGQCLLDVGALLAAFYLSYLLRFDFHIPSREIPSLLTQLSFAVPLQLVLLYLWGAHRVIWRYFGMGDLRPFLQAISWATLPLLLLRFLLPDTPHTHVFKVPISVTILDFCFAFGGVLCLRVIYRTSLETQRKLTTEVTKKSVLLIGAGRVGAQLAREMQTRSLDLIVKGFIEDNPSIHKFVIHGIPVLGAPRDLPHLVPQLDIDHVIIALPQASRRQIKELLNICEQIPVKARIVPGLHEILQDKVQVSQIRDLQIEDLLGREQVHLDEDLMHKLLTRRRVMVTGAGGSIGSELARQVLRFNPAELLLVERAENALFNIDCELRETASGQGIVPLVGDVSDERRMRSIFEHYRPQVVLHAAAHKHVPMMELNTLEAIKNNVLGTHTVGKVAGEYGVEAFVLISTDKAVRPRSVMGASKRVAELVIQHLDQLYDTRYVAVRFGNVIGSAGSVLPIFKEQIRRGGPVTVTHEEMTRYFMTIPEAAQLVLQAGAMGEGGEIFVLDMGEPVRILDLARDAIALSGLSPGEDIEIQITGPRPGEKLFEELQTGEEHIAKTRHPKIYIGRITPYPFDRVRMALEKLAFLAQQGQERELRGFLNELLPEANVESAAATATIRASAGAGTITKNSQ